jgi:hypothetical protein
MAVTGNTISTISTNGIYINFTSDLVVSGNMLYKTNTVADAVFFQGICILNSDVPLCCDNVVLFVSPAAGVYGIRGNLCTNGTFSGNVVKSHVNPGVILDGISTGNLVNGNRVVGGLWGVYLDTPTVSNYVYMNHCTGQSISRYVNLGTTNYVDSLTDGAMTVPGALTVTGNIAGSGSIRGLKATEALTSSAAITTAGRMLIDITNTSGSNTPTLVAPSSVDGQILILRCVALTAGTITLADSGNCALSAAWIPDAGDTLTLIASGVIWYEIARSAN